MAGENGDSYTETSSQSWGSRLMESIKGVLVGLILFIAAFPVLWMNEGCAIKTAKGLDEGVKVVTSVKADAVDPANNGKEVHMTGSAVTDEVLADKNFGISQKCIKLIRNVEMFQWKEESHSEKLFTAHLGPEGPLCLSLVTPQFFPQLLQCRIISQELHGSCFTP